MAVKGQETIPLEGSEVEFTAEVVALMRPKEVCKAAQPQVAVAILLPIKRVDLWVCVQVADALNVHAQLLATRVLKRKVGEGLRGEAQDVVVRVYEPDVRIVLDVDALNRVFDRVQRLVGAVGEAHKHGLHYVYLQCAAKRMVLTTLLKDWNSLCFAQRVAGGVSIGHVQ